ncbi:hypothetical protein IV500_01350 [Paeniglutamicibacter antarcticus]|uniref:Knr4/Smi1-like domain-containing protein n=1 Tax=Arthrobacter terrae TaxID=2935737 RepID=A0A931CKZ9_9MICC|nr:hypothetical protein [Arthrobacter terrae]MBG0738080.1 hypothetical protein [Arthrobacter terrae]
MSDMFLNNFRALVAKYLDEPWLEADGIPLAELDELLAGHNITVPQVLREFLHAVGGCEDLMEAYYYFWDPEELQIEDGYLLFLEDEDEEFTWGFRAEQLAVPDPIIWRRNNATGAWTSEDGTFSEFVFDMFDWVFSEDDDDVDMDVDD